MSNWTERPTTKRMNRVSAAIIFSLVVISACIIFLVQRGISLRAALLIQPSTMDSDQSNVAKSLIIRLYQELQNNHYVIWGALPETPESRRIINRAAEEYEKVFHQSVKFIRNAENASEEYLRACSKPCWLLVSTATANQLEKNDFIENRILVLDRPFFSITVVPFQSNEAVSNECEAQKRLTLKCFVPVSIRSVKRKIKDPQKRYFFLNKYYENDYFLFLQVSP